MSNTNIPYDGYPAPGADSTRNQWKGWIRGISTYQAGGYNLNASQLGMSGIEDAWPAFRSQSGNYYATVNYPVQANNGNDALPRAIPAPYVVIKWFSANGTEATNNNTALPNEFSLLSAFGV